MKKPRKWLQYFLITLVLISFSQAGNELQDCPINMVFLICSHACQRVCEAPRNCQEGVCTEREGCVCPRGFFMNGSDCVRQEECGCYESGSQSVIPEGDFYVNPECTLKGVCNNGEIHWKVGYQCGHNADCDVRENGRQCYCSEGYVGDGETCMVPKDCQEIYEDGSKQNGVYKIKPAGWTDEAFEVYCNMSDGGGWTVFQRRVNGTENFYLNWNDYKKGFGNLDHEFWLGNDKLYYLTNQKRYEIRIDLVNRYGAPYYAKFDYFIINDESDNYRLSGLGIYSGTAESGYALNYHLNRLFSTKDRDNDSASSNCAVTYHGAWWYHICHRSNLNGEYFAPGLEDAGGICWKFLPDSDCNITYTEMKIRPI